MSLGAGVLATALAVAAAYNIALVVVTIRFRRRTRRLETCARPHARDRDPTSAAPGVSILVPLDGAEPTLFANLAAYCQLRHEGAVQVVVGSLVAGDPAIATARRVASRYSTVDFQIVVGAATLGPNRKASLLAALAAHARHAVIVAVDSDVRVGPDYLSAVLPALSCRDVGLVSCVYRAPRPTTLAHVFEALCIETDFCPSVILASALGRQDIALGATIAIRSQTLDRVGGFAALVEHLADDHRLGELVRAIGERAVLAAYVVESDPNPASLAGAVRHQVRWARTIRACAPWGYFGSILTHGMTLALCGLLLDLPPPYGVARLAIAVIALRLAAAALGARALGARLGWTLALVPLRDVVATAIWAASFASNRIEWRGRCYRIGADGHLSADPPLTRHRSDTCDATVGYQASFDIRSEKTTAAAVDHFR